MKKLGKTWDEFVEEKAKFDDLNRKTIVKFKSLAVDRIPFGTTGKSTFYKLMDSQTTQRTHDGLTNDSKKSNEH